MFIYAYHFTISAPDNQEFYVYFFIADNLMLCQEIQFAISDNMCYNKI